jgi:hypothetical protein
MAYLVYTAVYFGIIFLGGWFFVAAYLYNKMSTERKLDNVIGKFMSKQDYVVVQLFPPAENERSMAEMEYFYVNLASIFRNISEKDLFIDGKVLEAYSFEIHSRGGQVGFYVRLNRSYLSLLRSSLAAHYPGSDTIEVPDPLETWPKKWEGSAGPYTKMLSMDLTLGKSDFYPLKSWTEFQRDDNSPLTDPISTLITSLENIDPKDYAVIQFILKPNMIPDVIARWKKELIKVRQDFKENSSMEIGDDGAVKLLTKQEQNILNACELKISGDNYQSKVRVGFFTAGEAPVRMLGPMMGYFKQYASEIQFVKPDTGTKPGSSNSRYWGPFVDKNYWARENSIREKYSYLNLKNRSFTEGSSPVFINVAALAALFHFPTSTKVDQSLLSRVAGGDGGVTALPGGGAAPRDLPT